MAQANYGSSGTGQFTSTETGTSSVAITLPTPGAGKVNVIDSIWVYTVGTITAWNVAVLKNDGSTDIARFGGQASGAAGTTFIPCFVGPVVCAKGDAAKVNSAFTGASASQVTVNWHIETA